MNIEKVIRYLHDSEINGEIGWFYDGVWWANVGDEAKRFDVEGRCGSLAESPSG